MSQPTSKKAVIFAPFWRMAGHVGNNRVDRFVRWLAEDGYTVVMIRAGSEDGVRQESWGNEITVCDRIGLHRDTPPGAAAAASARKPNKLRRALAYWLFNPDPTVVWARAAANHPAVLKATEGATLILSTSPPESAHVGAWKLSRRVGVPYVVDMRDGWLDEPLKPILRSSALRRWLESRLEARILHDADAIQVTSDVWKKLLCERYPALATKVHVLTNGYPQDTPEAQPTIPKGSDAELELIHSGRFAGSDTRRTLNLLLEPLLKNLCLQSSRGVIRLIGSLSEEELKAIQSFKLRFQRLGWHIECPGSMPRSKLLELLPQADGLLLLSTSHAALPSKLFEYIPTGRPILAITSRDSATWTLTARLPQARLAEPDSDDYHKTISEFLQMAKDRKNASLVPQEYSEQSLSLLFRKTLPRAI